MTTISWAASSQELLTIGCLRAASSTAFATNSSGLTFTPASSGRRASLWRSFIIRVTSTVRNSVTCGAVKALATIAAATPRGLGVPTVTDAGRLSLAELAGALAQLTETARAGRTAPEDMTGGTITITNVGVFGVDTGTPILNPGESAILAFGAIREMPWVHKGKVRPRQVTQLALSFDHRIIDGELGSRFLADVGALLSDPGTALAF